VAELWRSSLISFCFCGVGWGFAPSAFRKIIVIIIILTLKIKNYKLSEDMNAGRIWNQMEKKKESLSFETWQAAQKSSFIIIFFRLTISLSF